MALPIASSRRLPSPVYRSVIAGSEALPHPSGGCMHPIASSIGVISCRAKDEFPSIPGVTTLYESLERSVKLNGSSAALGYRPIDSEGKAGDFEWITYSELESAASFLSHGISRVCVVGHTCGACWASATNKRSPGWRCVPA